MPGLGSGEEAAIAAAARGEPDPPPESEPPAAPREAPDDPGARIDAARERLRAKIEPPPDPAATD